MRADSCGVQITIQAKRSLRSDEARNAFATHLPHARTHFPANKDFSHNMFRRFSIPDRSPAAVCTRRAAPYSKHVLKRPRLASRLVLATG